MASRIDTEVLIAGGSPVGLTLGIGLAHRGIDVTLAAVGAAGEPPREMQPCQRPHNGEILSSEHRARRRDTTCVCRKSDSAILMVKAAKDRS
jgi:thioredoxin reductase